MFDSILESVPLWLIGLLLIAACILAARLGGYLRRRGDQGSAEQEPEKSDAEAYIIGAIFGLLAFIIGLTFSIAVDRFDTRRGWVAEEATAINTVFLRAGLFDEPHRSQLQSTIRAYAHTRVAPDEVLDQRIEGQVARSHQLKRQLWDETRAAVYPIRETDQASYFVEAMNEALNIGTRRELAGTAHIPTRILVSLLLYLLVASGVLGYLLGESASRYRHTMALLFALFAISIIVILDLDRPRTGSIKVSQQALEDLVAELDRVTLPAAPPRPSPGTAQP